MFSFKAHRKHKIITVYATLAVLVLYTGLSTLTAILPPKPSFEVNPVLAEDTIPLSSDSLSLLDSNNVLAYLKKLDSPSGRTKFDAFFSQKQTEKETLIIIQNRLTEMLTGKTRFHGFISRFNPMDFLKPDDVTPPELIENPTIYDLSRRMALEVQVDQLLIKKTDLTRSLVQFLQSNEAVNQLSSLEALILSENELLNLIHSHPNELSLALTPRLLLLHAWTDVAVEYGSYGRILLDHSLKALNQDTVFIEDKLTQEQSILELFSQLYPTSAEQQAQALADDLLMFFDFYQTENAELMVRQLGRDVFEMDLLLKALSPNPDFPFHEPNTLQRLSDEALGTLKAESFDAVAFFSEAQALMTYFTSIEDSLLNPAVPIENYYQKIQVGFSLIPFTDPQDLPHLIDFESAAYSYLGNVERLLKRQFMKTVEPEALLVPAEVPVEVPAEGPSEVPAQEPVESPVEIPVEGPIEEPIEEPIGNVPPLSEPAEALPELPVEPLSEVTVPAQEPVESPVEGPIEGPVEGLIEEPIENVPLLPEPAEDLPEPPVEPLFEIPPVIEEPQAAPSEVEPETPEFTPEIPPSEVIPTTEVALPEPEVLPPPPEIPTPELPEVPQVSVIEVPAQVVGLDYFDETLALASLLATDPDLAWLTEILNQAMQEENTLNLIRDLLDKVDTAKIDPKRFHQLFIDFGLTANQYDELRGYLNRLMVRLDLIDPKAEFSGINGVLRFGNDQCPMNSGPTLGFCFALSDDISTRNLIGRPDYQVLTSDSYPVSHPGIALNFLNNPTRDIKINLGSGGDSFTLSHSEETDPENSGLMSYALSALENPAQLQVPVNIEQKEAFEHLVAYEQRGHRKNAVMLFTDDAHLIVPRHLKEYTIFNFGSGIEHETTVFNNIVLRSMPDGTLEGYIFDPLAFTQSLQGPNLDSDLNNEEAAQEIVRRLAAEISLNGLKTPDFILAAPFVLDRNGNQIEGVGYEVSGDTHNQLSILINADPALYPIVLDTELQFTAKGQTYYDSMISGQPSDLLGASLATGELNGDGFPDFAIGSPGTRGQGGRVDLYFSGDLVFPDVDPSVVISGEAQDEFGETLALADLNGDGVSDLVAGSQHYDNQRGRVWIFYGPFAVAAGAPLFLSADQADNTLTGSGAADEFGSEILTADLNHDLKTDLVVAAPGAQNEKGAVYLYLQDTLAKREPKAETLDFKFSGDGQEGSRFGAALTALDFDQDGTKDLVISEPFYDASVNQDTGRIYLFLQNEIPWTTGNVPCLRNCSAATADATIEGESSGSLFGSSLVSGDFTDDSLQDLAVSAPGFGFDEGTPNGRVYVYTNRFLSNLTPDVVLSPREADLKITGMAGEKMGVTLASFDSTRVRGLLIGAPDYKFSGGSITLYYSKTLAEALSSNDGFLDAYQSHDFRWEGMPLGRFGSSPASADLTGDGISDFIFSSPSLNSSQGAAYFFTGKLLPVEVVTPIGGGQRPTEEEVPPEEVKPAAEITPPVIEEVTPEAPTPPEFTLEVEQIEEALNETIPQTFALDISVPLTPTIQCPGFVSGILVPLYTAICSWDDTAGPSQGTTRYCVDTENSCTPGTEAPNRVAEIGALTAPHTFFRVQTEDLGGKSEIASFDLSLNHAPVFIVGPSDGGSDILAPTVEGGTLTFTATAKDQENNSYSLLVCKTSDLPVFDKGGKPTCAGDPINRYCLSNLTPDGQEATCSYETYEESLSDLLWYAYVCDANEGGGLCSALSQGEGVTGSPAYLQHPQTFGSVVVTDTQGNSIGPGDSLKFTLKGTEVKHVLPGGTVTMHICNSDSVGFDYEKDECLGGQHVCHSFSINPQIADAVCQDTEGVMKIKAPTPAGEYPYQVYVEHGEKGLAEGLHTQTYQVTDVSPTLVSYENTGSISIMGGGSTEVMFSIILRDLNGSSDIQRVKGVLFDADSVTNRCTVHTNDCAVDDNCIVTPFTEMDARADCTVTLRYNANASQNWKAHIVPFDSQGEVLDLPDSDQTREVPSLIAINQAEVQLQYNLTAPGEVSEAVSTILTNLGNQPVDVLIGGTDLVGSVGNIPRENQKWSLQPDFNFETEGYGLIEIPESGQGPELGCANVTLPVHDEDTAESPDVPVYWKIQIPKFLKADLYKGSVTFAPAEDACR